MDEIKFNDVESMAEMNPNDCNALQKLWQCIWRASSTAESDIQYLIEHLQWYSVCDPAKIFLTSKFSCLVFCNTTNKIEIGTSNRCGNHLHESLWWANQKYWAAVISYLLHSFLEVHKRFSAIHQAPQNVQLYWAKTSIPEPNQHVFLKTFIPF